MNRFGVVGLAIAAGLSAVSLATVASASTALTLNSSGMDTNYTVNLTIPANGAFPAQNVTAYSNGVLFDTSDGVLYGFCFDVYHDMYLGTLNLSQYTSNQSDGGGLAPNSPQTLNATQDQAITNLVDTGWLMFQGETSGHWNDGANADTEMRLAAIQAAIWYTENNSYLDPNQFSGQFKTYFDNYAGINGGSYTPLNTAQDKVFTISNQANQSFAIGWPIDVPEPATWALMLTGFFGMGSVLRRQRKAAITA